LKVVLSGNRAAASSVSYPYVIYNEGKQYWNVFKPVIDEFESRGDGGGGMFFTLLQQVTIPRLKWVTGI
jgi:hypothetical protein